MDGMALFASVQAELGDLLDEIDRHGAVYARACCESMETNARRQLPRRPPGLRPVIAALVRDLVLEQYEMGTTSARVRLQRLEMESGRDSAAVAS